MENNLTLRKALTDNMTIIHGELTIILDHINRNDISDDDLESAIRALSEKIRNHRLFVSKPKKLRS